MSAPDPFSAALRGLRLIAGLDPEPDPETASRLRLAEALSAGAPMPADRRPSALISIFHTVEGASGPPRVYPLLPLNRQRETLFPKEATPEDPPELALRNLEDDLKKSLEEALRDARDHPSARVAGAMGAMARFAWCLPGPAPDISRYDHGRTVGAFAALLAEAPPEGLAQWEAALQAGSEASVDTPPVALLVKGDVSGIQRFLYQVTGKGAARGLRGRSLYLQLLSEAVALFVLRRLRLPLTNLLYSGGGHFLLLARPADETRLPEIRREVTRRLAAFHGPFLALVLAAVPIRPHELHGEGLQQAFEALHRRLAQAKARRLEGLPPEDWEAFLVGAQPDSSRRSQNPADHAEKWTDCMVCGIRGLKGEEIVVEREGRSKCKRCRSLEDLGRAAVDLQAIAWIEREPLSLPDRPERAAPWEKALQAFGFAVSLFRASGPKPSPEPPEAGWALVWLVEDSPDLRGRIRRALGERPIAFFPRFLLRRAPRVRPEDRERFARCYDDPDEMPEAGDVRDFTMLQHSSRGIQRLGVLRADLDGAGALFSRGLGKAMRLARLMALSSALSRFFEGYVETLCETVERETGRPDTLYAVYAGGDDLFIVGAWDVVADFAARLRRELAEYTGHHPRLTLSAALTLHDGREAVHLFAEEAGRALEEGAKAYQRPDGKAKDALRFLERTLPWGPEEAFWTVLEWSERFRQGVESAAARPRPGRGRSLLFALIRWGARPQRARPAPRNGPGQPILVPWIWHAAYFIRRWQDLTPAEDPLREVLDAMRREWDRWDEQGGPIALSRLLAEIWMPAARWAELRTRHEEGCARQPSADSV
ncbi:type III-A CRISPR-associated protein Cas10/Csm1 [Thermoflexus hugenholtzii]